MTRVDPIVQQVVGDRPPGKDGWPPTEFVKGSRRPTRRDRRRRLWKGVAGRDQGCFAPRRLAFRFEHGCERRAANGRLVGAPGHLCPARRGVGCPFRSLTGPKQDAQDRYKQAAGRVLTWNVGTRPAQQHGRGTILWMGFFAGIGRGKGVPARYCDFFREGPPALGSAGLLDFRTVAGKEEPGKRTHDDRFRTLS
jgi:hypothetical protein